MGHLARILELYLACSKILRVHRFGLLFHESMNKQILCYKNANIYAITCSCFANNELGVTK